MNDDLGDWQDGELAPRDEVGDDEPVGPTLLTNLGGVSLMVASFLSVLAGVLIWRTSVIYATAMRPAPWLMMALGLAGLVCGGAIVKARDWAAIGGAGITALLLLVNLGFNVWAALNHGFYSWSAIAMVATIIAALLVPLSVKDCLVASRNHRRLLDGV